MPVRVYLSTGVIGLIAVVILIAVVQHYAPRPAPPDVRITFVEGSDAHQMSSKVAQSLPGITAAEFYTLASQHEGYLFPDTYLFPPYATSSEVIGVLLRTFDNKLRPLIPAIAQSRHTIADVVIMASILEREAQTTADRKIIAGILWRRLAIGMPLQVDAAPETYEHKGLPPRPICNPGLNAIEAVLKPTPTNYLYYLTGKDGLMHYAVTFESHKANRAKYLD